jgi:hypothetical protein
MEKVSISEMSVDLYVTKWRKIPEDTHLHACRLENLKSPIVGLDSLFLLEQSSCSNNFEGLPFVCNVTRAVADVSCRQTKVTSSVI